MTTTLTSPASDFDEFYTSNLADVVALVCTITANVSDAQDLAQEAFCRAWARWPDLSTYDNPGAWVRRVAVNLAYSRWRRLKVATAYLIKQRVDDVAPVDPEHLALLDELKAIPATQRRAIVLHHLMDLPVGDVATEMGVGEGTVKSWLHRGRNALAIRLSDTPGAAVRKQAEQRRTRARIATATLAVLAVVGIVLTVVLAGRPSGNPFPIGNTPSQLTSPSPVQSSPQPGPSIAPQPSTIEKTKWSQAEITLGPGSCTQGKAQFEAPVTGGEWVAAVLNGKRIIFFPGDVTYGDLNGDGRAEAAMEMSCGDAVGIVAIEQLADRTLRTLDWAVENGELRRVSMWITGGVLYAERRVLDGKPFLPAPLEAYRLAGGTFDKTSAASAYPYEVVPTKDGARLDLKPVLDKIQCGGAKPAATDLNFGADGRFTTEDTAWRIMQPAGKSPLFVNLDPADFPYLLIRVECGEPSSEYLHNLVLFAQTDTGWRALDVIAEKTGDKDIHSWHLVGQAVRVAFGDDTTPTRAITYAWSGTGFVKK